MAVVFILGLLVSSLMERRAEVASVFNNKRTVFEDEIIAQNEKFKADYPREYETWAMTEDTTFKSKYNSSQEVDVLEQRPEMVVLWAGYAFSRHYNTPRGHKHALEDMRKILRTGNPGITVKTADGRDSIAVDMQPATCWTCKGPDVPRMMRELGNGKDQFYGSASCPSCPLRGICPSRSEREERYPSGDAFAGMRPVPCGVLLHQAQRREESRQG